MYLRNPRLAFTLAACLITAAAASLSEAQSKPEPLGARGGNYLIISASDYVGSAALNQFITHKEGLGFTVSTYEAVSGTSNSAIEIYIDSLWGTGAAPDYVLIVGDTNGFNATSNCVPHFDGGGDKTAATDWPYVCDTSGVSWYPDIPIGRFSVRTTSSLQDVVDKTIFVEQGNFPDPDYVKRGAFLANPSTYGQAEPTHDWVIDTYFTPNNYDGIKLYASQGAGTSDVTNAVNDGALFVLYFGHSSSSSWWDPSFGTSNVNSLSNTGLYGLAFGWSCNTAHYTYDECVGETWLRAPNKGAAAYLSASDYIYWGSVSAWAPSVALEKAFFTSIFEDDVWEVGPAWVGGLYRFLADYGGWDGNPDHGPTQNSTECRNFFEEFVLLGDPALLLPKPEGFSLAVTPPSQDVCAPPTTQVTYSVEVGQQGEFSEVVTLSLAGEPTGASVSFDVNGQAPPFTSTLTVGALDGVAAGDYTLIVTGTSATKVRSSGAALNIAAGIPAAPVLTDPLDGAGEVSLMPTFTWDSTAGAVDYDLQVATDVGFSNIVRQIDTTATSHELVTPLAAQTAHYWRVRASNACGDGDYASPFSFVTVNVLMPATYDLLNGESGLHSYYDDNYNGLGDNGAPLAALTDGLGDLTDGVIATQHWNSDNVPYVGWRSIEPTITFHFAETTAISELTIHVDDSGGGGGVVPPSDIEIVMGGDTLQFEVTDPAGSAPFAFTCIDLGLSGTTLELTLLDDEFSTGRYMMLSEVEFAGAPPTGACCEGESCSVLTEADCLAASGEYLGDGTDCDPNPCISYDPSCLIISEIVQGVESGDCPRWLEITNTGLTDFAFLEGGVIVQTDDDTDVFVDLDLSGVTIAAGQSYVIVSSFGGACTGAFDAIYPVSGDFYTDVPLGYGNERLIISDTADGSNLVDIYGEFGVNGAGQDWEFTDGYSYRRSPWAMGAGSDFAAEQWFFGGVGSLTGGDPTHLLLTLTTPGVHVYDNACCDLPGDLDADGDIDLSDLAALLANYGEPSGMAYKQGDVDGDGDVDLSDLAALLADFGMTCD